MPENLSQAAVQGLNTRQPGASLHRITADGNILLKHVQVLASSELHPPRSLVCCVWTLPVLFVWMVQAQDGGSGPWRPAQFPDRKCFCCISPLERSEVTQLLGNSVGGWQAVGDVSQSHAAVWSPRIDVLFTYNRVTALKRLLFSPHDPEPGPRLIRKLSQLTVSFSRCRKDR